MSEMKQEIEALQGMTTSALARRYTEVWGKPPRIKHAEFLKKRIAWKILEQRYGGLSEVAKKRRPFQCPPVIFFATAVKLR